jgi:ribosome-associated translation inhibitor RaiA
MQFQFNSDNRISGHADVAEQVETLVRGRLDRVADRLTRVEVHVGDVNGPKGGNDIRCAVELRPNGMKPISATDEASSMEAAVASATAKALSAYDRQIGKLTTRKGH